MDRRRGDDKKDQTLSERRVLFPKMCLSVQCQLASESFGIVGIVLLEVIEQD